MYITAGQVQIQVTQHKNSEAKLCSVPGPLSLQVGHLAGKHHSSQPAWVPEFSFFENQDKRVDAKA